MTDLIAPAVPRVTARRARTRERLMAAAVRVFAERGVIGASVEEICEEAGFTRGAFYSNFAGKDELVMALIRSELDQQYAAAEQAITAMKDAARRGSPAEDLVSIALSGFEAADPHGREGLLTRHELLLYAAREPAVREPYVAFTRETQRQFSTLIADAVRTAGLEFTVDFTDAVALLGATYDRIHTDTLFSGQPVDWRPLGVLVLALTRPASRSGRP